MKLHNGINRIGTGDNGQRYEVRCKDGNGKEMVVGWANTTAGANTFVTGVNNHPSWNSPEVIDRRPDQDGDPVLKEKPAGA